MPQLGMPLRLIVLHGHSFCAPLSAGANVEPGSGQGYRTQGECLHHLPLAWVCSHLSPTQVQYSGIDRGG